MNEDSRKSGARRSIGFMAAMTALAAVASPPSAAFARSQTAMLGRATKGSPACFEDFSGGVRYKSTCTGSGNWTMPLIYDVVGWHNMNVGAWQVGSNLVQCQGFATDSRGTFEFGTADATTEPGFKMLAFGAQGHGHGSLWAICLMQPGARIVSLNY